MRRFTALLAAGATVVVAGCGSSDPTSSDEYVALTDERDDLQAELDTLEIELDEVDDALAVSEAELANAEAELAALEGQLGTTQAMQLEYESLLHADLATRVGMNDQQADCVGDALFADDMARSSYLFLISADNTDPAAANDALESVTAVFTACGLEVGETSGNGPAEIDPAALGDPVVDGDELPRFDDAADDPAVGLTAPVVSGADYDGTPVVIDAAATGPTMVMVLAHWCPHCNAEIPRINQLRDEGRVPDGVDIVAISTGISPDRANYPPGAWLEASDWTYPVIADGVDPETGVFVAADAYGTSAFPYVVLLDGNGTVVERWTGETDVTVLESALRTLAAG